MSSRGFHPYKATDLVAGYTLLLFFISKHFAASSSACTRITAHGRFAFRHRLEFQIANAPRRLPPPGQRASPKKMRAIKRVRLQWSLWTHSQSARYGTFLYQCLHAIRRELGANFVADAKSFRGSVVQGGLHAIIPAARDLTKTNPVVETLA